MQVAKKILNFLQLIQENRELVHTIKNILKVFPEGVLIQSLDETSRKVIIKFANNIIQNYFFKSDNSEGKTIETEVEDLIIKNVSNVNKADINDDSHMHKGKTFKFSEFIEHHSELASNTSQEIISQIEIIPEKVNFGEKDNEER